MTKRMIVVEICGNMVRVKGGRERDVGRDERERERERRDERERRKKRGKS